MKPAQRHSNGPVAAGFLDFGNGMAKKWVDEVPRIRLSIVKDAGHIIWVDQPEEFVKQLAFHLKK